MPYLELDKDELKQLISTLRQQVHTLVETADTNIVSQQDLVVTRSLLDKCINEYNRL